MGEFCPRKEREVPRGDGAIHTCSSKRTRVRSVQIYLPETVCCHTIPGLHNWIITHWFIPGDIGDQDPPAIARVWTLQWALVGLLSSQLMPPTACENCSTILSSTRSRSLGAPQALTSWMTRRALTLAGVINQCLFDGGLKSYLETFWLSRLPLFCGFC